MTDIRAVDVRLFGGAAVRRCFALCERQVAFNKYGLRSAVYDYPAMTCWNDVAGAAYIR